MEYVEVAEYFDGKGNLYKKTVNGIEMKIQNDLLPTVAIQKFYITKEEYENNYKKWLTPNEQPKR